MFEIIFYPAVCPRVWFVIRVLWFSGGLGRRAKESNRRATGCHDPGCPSGGKTGGEQHRVGQRRRKRGTKWESDRRRDLVGNIYP